MQWKSPWRNRLIFPKWMQTSDQSPCFSFHRQRKKEPHFKMTDYTIAKSTTWQISHHFKCLPLWVSLAFTIHLEALLLVTFPITVLLEVPGSRNSNKWCKTSNLYWLAVYCLGSIVLYHPATFNTLFCITSFLNCVGYHAFLKLPSSFMAALWLFLISESRRMF